METMKKESTGTADSVQNIEIKANQRVQDSVMNYDTKGLVVGSKKRKQMRDEARDEKAIFHEDEVGFFKLKYSLIKPILDFAKAIEREFIQLVFQEAGMHARFVDPGNIVMGIFFIAKEEFMQYERKDNKEWKLGVDVEKVHDLKIQPGNQIDVILKTKRTDGEIEEYRIRYLEAEVPLRSETSDWVLHVPKIPDLKTYNYAMLPPKRIHDFLKATVKNSYSFSIALSRGGIELRAKTDAATIATIIPGEGMSIELSDEGTVSKYPILYTLRAFNAIKNASMMKIRLGEPGMPMQVDFYIGRKKHETESTAIILVAARDY